MPIKNSVAIDDVIELLNEATKMDQQAITDLINNRVLCNDVLSLHPTIQVDGYSIKGKYRVGLLGILNGFFGMAEDGYGAIAANYELICPQEHSTKKGQTIEDKCKICGSPLELGKIIEFRKIR